MTNKMLVGSAVVFKKNFKNPQSFKFFSSLLCQEKKFLLCLFFLILLNQKEKIDLRKKAASMGKLVPLESVEHFSLLICSLSRLHLF